MPASSASAGCGISRTGARIAAAALGLALAGLAAYADSFSGPFVFDDMRSIVSNPTLHRLWPLTAALHPPASSGAAGRPLLNLSFALSYAISGLGVWSYHALNLAIHIAAGLALFGILRRTLERIGDRWRSDALPLAFFAALIWILHPAQTASVAYISERAESLMGLFYLLTLYCFIRGARLCPLDAGSAAEVEPNLWFGLSWLACLLGMAAKEVMVTAPVAVLLYDRCFVAGSFAEALKRRWRFYLGLVASWALLAVLLSIGQVSRSAGYGLGTTAMGYALTECWVVPHYLFLAFWPHPLIFDRGLAPAAGRAALWAIVLIGLAALVLAALFRRPRLGFASAWFFLILAPTSSVVPVINQPMAENRLYLPLAGLAALFAVGLWAWLGRACWIALAAAAVGCGALTAARNRDYRSELALWQVTARQCPDNPRARNNLGAALAKVPGRLPEAIAEYRAAIRLDPHRPDALTNLGNALFQAGAPASEAIAEYRAALEANPRYAEAHYNLGALLLNQGRAAEAFPHFRAAADDQPNFAPAYAGLGLAAASLGRTQDAIAYCRRALMLDPGDSFSHALLSRLLASAEAQNPKP